MTLQKTNKCRYTPGIGRLNCITICSLHQFNKQFNNISIKFQERLLKNLNLKFIWKNKVAKNRNDTSEKNVGGLTMPGIQIY